MKPVSTRLQIKSNHLLQHKATSGTYNVFVGLAVKHFAQLKYTKKPKIAKKKTEYK